MLAMALSGLRIEEPAAKQQAEVYYHLLTRWADYLVREAIFPKRQSESPFVLGSTPRFELVTYALANILSFYLQVVRTIVGPLRGGSGASTKPRAPVFGSQKNTTSLVIKGIMGIRSMAEIASDLGKEEDQVHYQVGRRLFAEPLL